MADPSRRLVLKLKVTLRLPGAAITLDDRLVSAVSPKLTMSTEPVEVDPAYTTSAAGSSPKPIPRSVNAAWAGAVASPGRAAPTRELPASLTTGRETVE